MAKKIVWSLHGYVRGCQREIPHISELAFRKAIYEFPKQCVCHINIDGNTLVVRKTLTRFLVITVYKETEEEYQVWKDNYLEELALNKGEQYAY